MKSEYTKKDCERLREEKSPAVAFVLLILGGCALVALYLWVAQQDGYLLSVSGILVFGVLLSILVYYLVNRNVFKDLREQEFIVITDSIIAKEISIDYEAGSAVAGLGNMRPFNRYIYYLAEGGKINVDREAYEMYDVGERIDILISKNSKIFLRVESSEKHQKT